ncbi:MAG: sulfotransferase [Gemmatimonadota bacterium]|nr:sulfotransferase [Gemmatimonadota bacterium]
MSVRTLGERLAAPFQPPFPDEWAGDNRGYVPFIILGTARTGSSLLVQTLRSHPGVVSFGEVLNPAKAGYNTPGFENWRGVARRARDLAPVHFFETGVFAGYRDEIAAVGCKVFYAHVERPIFASAREWLRARQDLRVVHLRRRNVLRTYLSLVIARKTRVYGTRSPENRSALQVHLQPASCERFFSETTTQHDRYSTLFGDHRKLDIDYEDFVADRGARATSLQEFLDLRPEPLRAPLVKQEVRPLAEAITNFAELERHFASSRWAEHFDD